MANTQMIESSNGRVREYKETLSVSSATSPLIGDTVMVSDYATYLTIAGIPSGTASVRIEYTVSPEGAVLAGNANWIPWTAGDSATAVLDKLETPPVAFRAVATTASVTAEDVIVEAKTDESFR